MSKNSDYPKSLAQDSAPIIRRQDSFDGGMESDSVATVLSGNAVALLENARGHKRAISGRKGSTLFSTLELPSIGDNGEIVDGALSVLATSSSQYVYIKNYDTNTILTPESVDSKITIVMDDDILTPFTIDGIIVSYDETNNYLVKMKVVVPAEWVSASWSNETKSIKIRMRINASLSDISTNVSYYLIGNTIYVREQKDEVWIEYTVDGDRKPLNAISRFQIIHKSVVLFNLNGIYVLNDYIDSPYAYRINSDTPGEKLDVSSTVGLVLDKSAYNYAYTYTRMKNCHNLNRIDGESFIECETPPYFPDKSDPTVVEDVLSRYVRAYKPDGNGAIYTTIETAFPINSSEGYTYTIADDYLVYTKWVNDSVSEAGYYLYVLLDSEYTKVYVDFNSVTSTQEAIDAIELAIQNTVCKTARCKLKYSNKMVLYSINDEEDLSLAPTGELNMLGIQFSVASGDELSVPLHSVLRSFNYPDTKTALSNITHYSLYRSKDIYPLTQDIVLDGDPRNDNDTEVLTWVEDVPVVKIFKCSMLSTTSFSIQGTDYKYTDSSNTIKLVKIGKNSTTDTCTVSFAKSDTHGYIYSIDKEVTDVSEHMGVLGSNNLCRFTKVGTTVTLNATSPTISATDILRLPNKLLYWYDGTTSVIKSCTSAGVITTVDDDNKADMWATFIPTSRSCIDTKDDTTLNIYTSIFPLKSALYKPMPNTSMSVYLNGSIISAKFRAPEIYNSDVAEFKMMGFHKPSSQTNGKLQNGITDLVEVGNVVSVFTSTETYSIDLRNSVIKNNDYGESYTIISDPTLISKGIGVPQPDRWCETDSNSIIVITSEPAIREFTGLSYKKNLADGKIQNSYLSNMSSTIVSSYNTVSGLTLWGIKND